MEVKVKRGSRIRMDFGILGVALFACLLGVLAIYSASVGAKGAGGSHYVIRQITSIVISLAAFFLFSLVDYRKIDRYAFLIYAGNILLLIWVALAGRAAKGAQRWLSIGSFSFQPSELAKLTTVIVLARYLSRPASELKGLRPLMGAVALVAFPAALIIKQPDLGTGIILLLLLGIMLFLAGIPGRTLVIIGLVGLVLAPALWSHLEDYQRDRLLVMFDPDRDPLGSGYAINQSKIAIGSGGWAGRGWRKGPQTQLDYLPERTTDFIFATIGEEGGFAGGLLVIGTFALLLVRGLRIGRQAGDRFGMLAAGGIAANLFLHLATNIGMTVGLLPVVGLPLPFLSYGGSCLLVTMLSLGLLVNIRLRPYVF